MNHAGWVDMKRIKSGLTAAALREGEQQIIIVWDVMLTLSYDKDREKYCVVVFLVKGEGEEHYRCEHRRLEMARRDYLKQVHRHFGQQLQEIKHASDVTTKWDGVWACGSAEQGWFLGHTEEQALLHTWATRNHPPLTVPVYHYDRFWTRPRKPVLTTWKCPNGHATQIYRASEPKGYTAGIQCRVCGAHQTIEVYMNGEVHEH